MAFFSFQRLFEGTMELILLKMQPYVLKMSDTSLDKQLCCIATCAQYMTQAILSVRMDADIKRRFDAFCADAGMNATAAVSIFARAANSF